MSKAEKDKKPVDKKKDSKKDLADKPKDPRDKS